jgi:hypothetical protein
VVEPVARYNLPSLNLSTHSTRKRGSSADLFVRLSRNQQGARKNQSKANATVAKADGFRAVKTDSIPTAILAIGFPANRRWKVRGATPRLRPRNLLFKFVLEVICLQQTVPEF